MTISVSELTKEYINRARQHRSIIDSQFSNRIEGVDSDAVRADSSSVSRDEGIEREREQGARGEQSAANRAYGLDDGRNSIVGTSGYDNRETGKPGDSAQAFSRSAPARKSIIDRFISKKLSGNQVTKKVVKPKKKISPVDAAKKKQHLTEAISYTTDRMDDFIIATTKGHKDIQIWSTMTDDEIEILADTWLQQAQVDTNAAASLEYFLSLYDRIKVGAIVITRAYRTLVYYFITGINIRIY